jgi:hypothetical protein
LDHALDVLLRETALLVRDRDGFGLAAEEINDSIIRPITEKKVKEETYVPLSAAPTFIIPLASISKVTSI